MASSTASRRKNNAPGRREDVRDLAARRVHPPDLPEAKYLFITRDGVDAAASAVDRWHAPFDLGYTAAKARFAPPSDFPWYGARFVANQVRRRQRRLEQCGDWAENPAWWGPKPHDYRELMEKHPLDELRHPVEALRRVVVRGPRRAAPEQLVHRALRGVRADPVCRRRTIRSLGLVGDDRWRKVSAAAWAKDANIWVPKQSARCEALWIDPGASGAMPEYRGLTRRQAAIKRLRPGGRLGRPGRDLARAVLGWLAATL